MSWQAYVDDQLLATGLVQQAAILGQSGGVWATSAGFTLPPAEQTAIVGGFSNFDAVQTNGFHINGVKYFTLQAIDDHIYGKKGADGAVIVKTKQAILVAVYKPPVTQTECTNVVVKLAEYLKSVNY